MALHADDSRSGTQRIAALLEREAGLSWSSVRHADLSRVVREHAARLTGGSEERLAALAGSDVACLDDLVADVTVGETYFFRDPAQFEVLHSDILPDLLARHGRALRAWSAGCASGEEAYSLAIALAECGAGPTSTVLGTDISRQALRRAERAQYGQWSFRGDADELREHYFENVGGLRRPLQSLRRGVRFEWLNLAAPAEPTIALLISGMHLIFCRNVLIYLTPDSIAAVARRLHDSLVPGGWLVCGASDPGLAEHAPFEVLVLGRRVLYRRADPATGSSFIPRAMAPSSGAIRSGPAERSATLVRSPQRTPVRERGAPATPTLVPSEVVAQVRALADAGQHRAAAELVVAGLKAMPASAELHYLSAIICLDRGDPGAAAAAARRACYLDPDLVVAAITLAAALRLSGDLRGARRVYRRIRSQLADRPEMDLVPLGDGERIGGLRRSVEV